jgi:hypothetical protein
MVSCPEPQEGSSQEKGCVPSCPGVGVEGQGLRRPSRRQVQEANAQRGNAAKAVRGRSGRIAVADLSW